MRSTEVPIPATPRFNLFLAWSILVHGVLMLTVVPPSPPADLGHSPMRIALRTIVDTAPRGEAKTKIPTPAVTPARNQAPPRPDEAPSPALESTRPPMRRSASARPTPNPARRDATAATAAMVDSAVATTPAAAKTSREQAEPESAAAAQRVGLALRDALARYFSYPPRARHNGWSGDVALGVRIQSDGHLTRIRILRTSGHRVLDRAALRSLEKVESLPEAAAWLHGRHLDMVVPVHYRLKDG